MRRAIAVELLSLNQKRSDLFIKTAHDTIIVQARDQGLIHLPKIAATACEMVELSDSQRGEISTGPLSGYVVELAASGQGFHLSSRGIYLSADASSSGLSCDRSAPQKWETFTLVPAAEIHNDEGVGFIAPAIRDYQLGNLRRAIDLLVRAVKYYPKSDNATLYARLASDLLNGHKPSPGETVRVILQCRPDKIFETQWLGFLIGDRFSAAAFDGKHEIFSEYMIVVDSHIDSRSTSYYREAFRRGCRVFLIHLSDESFLDDTSAYTWCNAIWRNTWSPILARNPRVFFFPLGYKSGFAREGTPMPSDARQLIWSFAGDVKKSSRARMIDSMEQVGGGRTHLTSHFGSSDALRIEAYRLLLEDSIFIPCPAGFHSLDSFRVYEALEAGCIPIVESRPGFDYFLNLLGEHPIPTISDWGEAPRFISTVQRENKIDSLRLNCYGWWLEYKRSLRFEFEKSVGQLGMQRF